MKGLPTTEVRQRPRPPSPKTLVIWLLCLCFAVVGVDRMARTDKAPKAPDFSWDAIPTTKQLVFQPCYRGFRCARVELPLDYWNGTTDKTISLAVAMVPAKVPVADPRYGGPILLNPGGPGGSGVGMVLGRGVAIQTILDSPADPASESAENSTAKYYDVVGFDPRGVGQTTPGAHCFEAASLRESWNLRLDAQGILGSSDAVLGRRWSMVQALGSSCVGAVEDADVKQYVTTASVARDMLELVELFGQYRQARTWRFMAESNAVHRCEDLGGCASMKLPEIYVPGQEKLQYWGFSYGTLLGSTFASMFPDRVGRLVLDGVVHGPNYMKTLWSNNLHDTEKTMQAFYDRCAEGGPDSCPLAKSGSSPADIEHEVQSILAHLYHNPLQIKADTPEVVTWSDTKLFIFMALYAPIEGFPVMAGMLSALARGDEEGEMRRYLGSKHAFACAAKGNNTEVAPVDGEASMAIMCSDGDSQDFLNVTAFDAFWRELNAISPSAGSMWAGHRMNCAGWKIRPKYRFSGSFGGETSNPIMWIGNSADPVTPLVNAHKMKALFPGSEVLTQNSPGHCSLAAFSTCTVSHLRSYVHNGTLPAPGTVCEPIEIPFVHPSRDSLHLLSADDVRTLSAHQSLGRAFVRNGWGLGRAMLARSESGLGLRLGFEADEEW